ncbi:MAG: hypothetical protein ABI883_07870 [Chthoniobacterales bacterium]
MKQNRFTQLLAVGAVSALALSSAFAQTTTHETTTSTGTAGAGVSATTTTGGTAVTTTASTDMLDGTGTITTYSPGTDYITMNVGGSPSKVYTTKSTTVVDSTGAAVDMALLRSDLPVRYTYVKEGDRMVVSKITVQKPLSEIRTTETTTTTTSHK